MRVTVEDKNPQGSLYKKNCNSCEGLYPNSMDVRFSKACDNKCLFCIERAGIQSAQFDVSKMIASTCASGKREILILGGEPFLFVDHLLEYIRGIRPFVEKIYITTALPVSLTLNNKKVIEIIELVDGINCSVHYFTDAGNNRILNTVTPRSRLDILAGLLTYCPDKIRVMGNLCRGGLDNADAIVDYLKYMTNLGAKEIKLNELQFSPEYFVNFEEVMGDKLPSAYAMGCQRYIRVDGYRCLLKRSCFLVEDSKQPHFRDLFKALDARFDKKERKSGFLVLYEDGTLYNGWRKEGTEC